LYTIGKYWFNSYKYVFYNTLGDGPTDVELYLDVNDAINKTNRYAYLPLGEDNNPHTEEYIKEHYDEIKDKLAVYTYVFKAEDTGLVITDFSVSK
jgi:hypothetical protein